MPVPRSRNWPTPGFGRKVTHGPAEESPVGTHPVAQSWRHREYPVPRHPVGGEIVFTAKPVVVDPGRVRDADVDPEVRIPALVTCRFRHLHTLRPRGPPVLKSERILLRGLREAGRADGGSGRREIARQRARGAARRRCGSRRVAVRFNKGVEGSARDQAPLLPPAPGVYRFRDATGRVLYLGRATSLRSRVASYWGDLGDRAHLAPMVARVARVEAVACDSVHEAAWLERNLLQARKPPWNRAPNGGQESEVWIRLSDDAARPGLPSFTRKTRRQALRPVPGRPPGPAGGVRPLPRAPAELRGRRAGRHAPRHGPHQGRRADDRVALADKAAAVLGRDPAAVAQPESEPHPSAATPPRPCSPSSWRPGCSRRSRPSTG